MYEKTVFDNGLRLLTSTMPHTRSVSVALFIGAGSRYEDDKLGGLSHFTEHMLFKGTTRRPQAKEISGAIESVGGVMNASTDREATVYWAKVASPHFPLALDVLMDMLCDPLLKSEEMEKERLVVLEELKMTNDHPDLRADALIDETMWPDQPVGRDIGGTPESVRGLTREMMVEYMRHQYIPSNVAVCVAGNIDHSNVAAAVQQAMGTWGGGSPLNWYPVVDKQKEPQLALEYRDTDQAHLCIGIKGISAQHSDRYAVDLMNVALGVGMSSRLFLEVRERQGLAYDIHSVAHYLRDCGAMIIYCGVDPNRIEAAVSTILVELRRLHDGLPDEDLRKAKEFLKGRLLLRMEETSAVVGWLGGQELLMDEVMTPEEVVERVEIVTSEDVQRVARQLIVPEKLSMALVGPIRDGHQLQGMLNL